MNNFAVQLDNVTLGAVKEPVLHNVNFNVSKAEFVYLIGKTGSGKSSLLRCLYGDIPISSGKANVAGFDLLALKNTEIPYLRRKLGIIFQDFQLLPDRNTRENLFFVMKATGWKNKQLMARRSQEVLQLVGLENKEEKMPNTLSGGEQQRLVIARAILNDPVLILADEPTGNLDPDTSDDILKLLHKIKDNGTAVIMATHDYRLIDKFPSSIYTVEDFTIRQKIR